MNHGTSYNFTSDTDLTNTLILTQESESIFNLDRTPKWSTKILTVTQQKSQVLLIPSITLPYSKSRSEIIEDLKLVSPPLQDNSLITGSDSRLMTSVITIAFISLAGYNLYKIYRKKSEVFRELMKGPNRMILGKDDIEFEKMEKETKRKKGKTNSGKPANKQKGRKKKYLVTSSTIGVLKADKHPIYVKKFIRFEPKNATQTELKHFRDLRHENVNHLCGFFIDTDCAGLIYDYAQRGSLYDLLQRKEYNLDETFKFSLLTDLVKGMKFLHRSNVKIHGRLKSTNCVVDGRFTLKITDYSLFKIKQSQNLESLYDSTKTERSDDLLWTAPEILLAKDANKDKPLSKKDKLEYGSQKGDVYSFGIIIQEVCTRLHPFGTLNMSASSILKKIKKCPPLLRPRILSKDCPFKLKELAKRCWAQRPDDRPELCRVCKNLPSNFKFFILYLQIEYSITLIIKLR